MMKAAMRERSVGFTLLEILVVLVVVGVLATLVAPNVFRHVGTAKEATARSQIEMLGAALDAYRLDNGRYPTTEQGLSALTTEPTIEPRPMNWRGPHLRSFHYRPPKLLGNVGIWSSPRGHAVRLLAGSIDGCVQLCINLLQ